MSTQTKLPWEAYPKIWPTKSKFMTWVRGGIRAGLWKKHPVKLEFLKHSTFLVTNTNPRSMTRFPKVKMVTCAYCTDNFKTTEVEVDHITGNSSLRSMEDVQQFIEAMIMVTEDDLQILCKPCNKIKNYAEKEGISFDEARDIKLAILICKEKRDKSWLQDNGIVPASAATARRAQIEALLRSRRDDELERRGA